MTVWEYKIVTSNPYDASKEGFDALGKENWELVAAVSLSFAGISEEVQYIFKRRITKK